MLPCSTFRAAAPARSRFVCRLLASLQHPPDARYPLLSRQIFFLAGVGQPAAELLKSPFVEKLDARGYEVLLLNEPLDEIVLSHLREHGALPFQDVSKKGFRFGDEGACTRRGWTCAAEGADG